MRRLVVGALLATTWVRGQEPPPAPAPEAAAQEAEETAPPAPAPAEDVVLPAAGATTLSLAQALALALEHNFGMQASADSVRSSQLRYSAARSEFYPKLTPAYVRGPEDEQLFGLAATQRLPWSGGSVAVAGQFRSAPELDAPLTRSSDVRLLVTQPLLRGFGPNTTFFDLRNARRARQGQERLFELERQQLAVAVARAYYAIVEQRMLLAVARQSLRRSRSLLTASEARLQVGLVSKLDVFRAQLQASQGQESEVRADAELQGALERFRLLLGLSATEPIEPEVTALSETPGGDSDSVEVLVERALQQRLDLLEVRDQVDDARRAASLARQTLLPQLDLTLGVTSVGLGPTFRGAWDAADRRFTFQLSTSYPLERTADTVNKAVADLEVAARERSVRQRELEVEGEVRAAVRELAQIRKSVELQRQAVEVAAQQLRLATLRYQRGLASNFDVVDAEGSLVLARSTLVGLLTRDRVAQVDLRRVTGSLDTATEFGP